MRFKILKKPFNKLKEEMGTYNKESKEDVDLSEYRICNKVRWIVTCLLYTSGNENDLNSYIYSVDDEELVISTDNNDKLVFIKYNKLNEIELVNSLIAVSYTHL